jgi:hypothetical protein
MRRVTCCGQCSARLPGYDDVNETEDSDQAGPADRRGEVAIQANYIRTSNSS